MDARTGEGPIIYTYVKRELLHVVRENQKLSGKRCQHGGFITTNRKPVWPRWEASGVMVTIQTVLRGMPLGPTHGLTRGGDPYK